MVWERKKAGTAWSPSEGETPSGHPARCRRYEGRCYRGGQSSFAQLDSRERLSPRSLLLFGANRLAQFFQLHGPSRIGMRSQEILHQA